MEDKITLRRQLYASKTIEELCSLLETMGKDFRGPKMSRELCDLIYTLKTQRLRHRKDAGSFCRAGGVSSLVRMLPVSEETRDHILLLSTIANVCWLDGNAKTQVCNTTASFGPSRTYIIHGVCVYTGVQPHPPYTFIHIFFPTADYESWIGRNRYVDFTCCKRII